MTARPKTERRPPWWAWWTLQGSFSPRDRQWLGWYVVVSTGSSDEERRSWLEDVPEGWNTNPYLAGALLAATRTAGREQGPEVARIVGQTLQSTLGALGDRLVWTGLRPALAVWTAVALLVLGPWAAVVAWATFAVAQARLRTWAWGWGLRRGATIAASIGDLGAHRWIDGIRRVGLIGAGVLTAVLLAPERETLPSTTAALIVMVAGTIWSRTRRGPEWVVVGVLGVAWVWARLGLR